jgi:hypothetical protein
MDVKVNAIEGVGFDELPRLISWAHVAPGAPYSLTIYNDNARRQETIMLNRSQLASLVELLQGLLKGGLVGSGEVEKCEGGGGEE